MCGVDAQKWRAGWDAQALCGHVVVRVEGHRLFSGSVKGNRSCSCWDAGRRLPGGYLFI